MLIIVLIIKKLKITFKSINMYSLINSKKTLFIRKFYFIFIFHSEVYLYIVNLKYHIKYLIY